MRSSHLIFLLAAACGVTLAADSPFLGKWKLNPAKSQFAGTTMTYETLPSGEMQVTAEGQTYKFRIDGKEYPSLWGSTVRWKQLRPDAWETMIKQGEMTILQVTKVSPDGKTMTATFSGKKPNGEKLENEASWARVSGGPGLPGKWKSTKMQVSTEMWEIAANGEDGLCLKIVDYDAVCAVKFDGKEYACTGPTMPKNFTMSAQKTGERTLAFTEKIDGKVVFTDHFSVSADGKTITDEAAAAGSTEKVRVVYDRQ